MMASRPRHLGALAAGAILFGQLFLHTGAGPSSALLAALWMIGGLFGGNAVIVARRGSGARCWCGVLAGGTVAVLLAALPLTGPRTLLETAGATALPTAVLYGFAKVGCRTFGCCGWSAPTPGAAHGVQLQTLEAAASFLLALILIGIQTTGAAPAAVLVAFLTVHGTTRIFSRFGRGQSPSRALLSIDSGWLVLSGLLLALLRVWI
jgi:hypothetical protein